LFVGGSNYIFSEEATSTWAALFHYKQQI